MNPGRPGRAPLRIGVWGVGTWGEKHARVLHSLSEAELVGVHDRDPARAADVAERYGTRVFPTAEALLDAQHDGVRAGSQERAGCFTYTP